MTTKIYKLLTALTVCMVMLLATNPLAAQERTDAEIGFDREKVKASIAGENKFIKKEFLEQQADLTRQRMVANYNNYQAFSVNNSFVPVPVSGCDNMSFDNNTEGWSLYYSNDNYNQNNLLSTSGTDGTIYSTMGSSALSVINAGNPVDDTHDRITIVDANTYDPAFGAGPIKSGTYPGDKMIRLGMKGFKDQGREEVAKKFILTQENSVIKYSYAVVLHDINHVIDDSPYFKVNIAIRNDNGNVVLPNCASIMYVARDPLSQGFTRSPVPSSGTTVFNYFYKKSTHIIDLSQYVDLSTNPVVTLSFSVSDCDAPGHEAWAYVEAECMASSGAITTSTGASNFCIGGSSTFTASQIETFKDDIATWSFYQGDDPTPIATQSTIISTAGINTNGNFNYPYPGVYRVEYKITRGIDSNKCDYIYSRTIVVRDCSECVDCTSFNPEPGKKYLISAWVSERTTGGQSVQAKSYTSPFIRLTYKDVGQNVIESWQYWPGGDIIDGWQRISAEFTMPTNIDDLVIELDNGGSENVTHFDDVRIFPYNGSMKSFVYDQDTQRLMGELDESNYATFYEYDSEGGLIRVKKETIKGVKTIKETRSGNFKRP